MRGDREALRALEAELSRDPGPVEPWLVYGDALLAAGDPRGELLALVLKGESSTPTAFAQTRRQRASLFERESQQLFGDFAHKRKTLHVAWWRGLCHVYANEPFGPSARDELEALLRADALRLVRSIGIRLVSEDPRNPERGAVLGVLASAPPSLRTLVVECVIPPIPQIVNQLELHGIEIVWNTESLPRTAVRGFGTMYERLIHEHGTNVGLAIFDLERRRAATAGLLELSPIVEWLVLDHLRERTNNGTRATLGLLDALLELEPSFGDAVERLGRGGDDFAGLGGRDERIVAELELDGDEVELSAAFDGHRFVVAARAIDP